MVVLGLALFAAVAYSFGAWTMGPVYFPFGEQLCTVLPHFYDLNTRLEIVDTVLTLLIPSITISVLNIRIIYAVFKIHRDKRHMGSLTHNCNGFHSESQTFNNNRIIIGATSTPSHRYTNIAVPASNNGIHSQTISHRRRLHNSQVKVTKMLVLVSSIFLILNLPNHALRIYAFTMSIIKEQNTRPSKQYLFLQRLFQYLYYTNFAINFFLYNMCGRNFRHALRHLARKICYNIRYKCLRQKYDGEGIVAVIQVKKKSSQEEESEPNVISGQRNVSIQRCHSSHSGSRSGKGSKGSKGSRGQLPSSGIELRPSGVQSHSHSHRSHTSCHCYHSRENPELPHSHSYYSTRENRDFPDCSISHSYPQKWEFSNHSHHSLHSHHSRFAAASGSDPTSSSHRDMRRAEFM